MARPRKTLEDEWYDVFASWDLADQDAALRVLTQLNRQLRRGKIGPKAPAEEQTPLQLREGE